MERVRSVRGVPIRLTPVRWTHIVENHDELAGRMDEILDAVSAPDWVTRGFGGALIAWKGAGRSQWLAVCYREMRQDGFIITAFFTRRPKRKQKVWP